MICRACNSPELSYFAPVEDVNHRWWLQCHACGSMNSTYTYGEVCHLYAPEHVDQYRKVGVPATRAEHVANFSGDRNHFCQLHPSGGRFLDIGCLECCALQSMHEAGWEAWGFDVCPTTPAYCEQVTGIPAERVKIAEQFHADLFPHMFTAVLCSEVIEHLESPRVFLEQVRRSVCHGGTFTLQTPRPSDPKHPTWDQAPHLCILSERQIRRLLHEAGFAIYEDRSMVYPTPIDPRDMMGQLYVCRKK